MTDGAADDALAPRADDLLPFGAIEALNVVDAELQAALSAGGTANDTYQALASLLARLLHSRSLEARVHYARESVLLLTANLCDARAQDVRGEYTRIDVCCAPSLRWLACSVVAGVMRYCFTEHYLHRLHAAWMSGGGGDGDDAALSLETRYNLRHNPALHYLRPQTTADVGAGGDVEFPIRGDDGLAHWLLDTVHGGVPYWVHASLVPAKTTTTT
jgi:hypothetical protein